MPYLTPDTPPAGTVCRTIIIPDDINWLAIVNGALLELTKKYNFEKFGSLTPEETADYFFTLWGDFHDSECMVIPIGMVSMFGGIVPAKWLQCNGQLVTQAAYPDLFAVIGNSYGSSGTSFRVPNFDERMPYGAHGVVIPGITGGTATHTLTVTEMPAHAHTIIGGGGVVNAMATNKPFMGASTNVGTVGGQINSNGSGGAHNNLPPFLTINFGIYAGV